LVGNRQSYGNNNIAYFFLGHPVYGSTNFRGVKSCTVANPIPTDHILEHYVVTSQTKILWSMSC